MKITRRFTTPGRDIFETVEWERRRSRITDAEGRTVFEMRDAEVPKFWSQLATDIMVSKYFRKAGVPQYNEDGTPKLDKDGTQLTGPENSVRQVISRLVGCWRHWAERHNYFDSREDAEAFSDELSHMLLHQMAAPNSPQWFNTGLHWAYGLTGPAQGHWVPDPRTGEARQAAEAYLHPQAHACFIQSIKDDLVGPSGIMDLWMREARLFKFGSGTGSNFSSLRAENEPLSGGGKSSGLMSFLRIGDRAAGAIKSGGTTRRAAKMVCLDADHPDIEDFVNWKAREELKVAAMVEGLKQLPPDQQEIARKLDLKLDYDFNGEAYQTVSGQNSNNSVRLRDSFFEAVDADGEWNLYRRTDGQIARTVKARELWDKICFAAWRCADPGVQFDSTINAWHTCPESGRIEASNPCVTGDTLVATAGGWRRIKDLVGEPAAIVNGDGKVVWVDRIFRTGRKPVFELKTRSGYSLRLTADHRVRTANRGDVAASELTESDDVLLEKPGFGHDSLPEGMGELLGASISDGWSSLDGQATFRSALGESETAVATSIREIATRLRRYAAMDRGEAEKQFTNEIFRLDRATLSAVLRGLFTTDGSAANYGEVAQGACLDSTSLMLLRQAQLLLLGFGIKSKIDEHCRAQGEHTLRISDDLASLDEEVATDRDRLVDRVRSVTACGTEDVYDLIEPLSHHFVANGMVVHNCSEYMFLDDTACNLASINLMRFYDAERRVFDVEGYEHAVRLWTIVLEVSVLMAAYPSKAIAENSWRYRTLGLGFANLGAMLMQAGIPYDSEEARAVCGALSAILTGRSYAVSAEMARELGPFAGFDANREPMLRVIRNHRRAALGVPRDAEEYEELHIRPVPIDHDLFRSGRINLANAQALLARATVAWHDAVRLGERHGFRNAQTTVIAPTGTIGLLMDCDTTGVEPDFALTKFKKLAGGGYFKIANQSLRPSLRTLGYGPEEIDDILTYVMGTLSLDTPTPESSPGSGRTFREFLVHHGYTSEDLVELENQLPTVFELPLAFTAWSMPRLVLQSLGVDVNRARDDGAFNGLKALGLNERQIEALNQAVCGTQTIEGAPHLRKEHLPVFDCASACGRLGKRFIPTEGHIRMMAAAQPFVSGAISKTINLPAESDVRDIADAYRLSWELGLKANALYRDGSKLSQPLSTRVESDSTSGPDRGAKLVEAALGEASTEAAAVEPAISTSSTSFASPVAPASSPVIAPVILERIVERVVDRPLRRRLPETRQSITHRFNVSGHEGYLTVGLYEDGAPGELFITMAKEGSTIGGLMDCLGTAISVALQYGVPLESLVTKFAHQRFEPMGMTTNSDIPFAKSLVDYIFRWLGMEFISGYREQNAPKRGSAAPGQGTAAREAAPRRIAVQEPAVELAAPRAPGAETSVVAATSLRIALTSALNLSHASLMGDAPACDVCGSITVRNGSCYKCMNCGNSMGCS